MNLSDKWIVEMYPGFKGVIELRESVLCRPTACAITLGLQRDT